MFIEHLTDKASSHVVHYGYQHGDAHTGNLFYDPMTDKVYFIDVAIMHDSFDKYGNPHADSCLDFIRIEESIRRKGYGLLPQNEIETLIESFETAYAKEKELPDPFLRFFHTAYIKIGKIYDYADWHMLENSEDQLRLKGIYDDAIHFFKKYGQLMLQD